MKRTILTLLIFSLFVSLPFAHAATTKKSKLLEKSHTPTAIYLELTPATKEPIKRVRIIRVEADNADTADLKMAHGQMATLYKRRTSRIRMGGLRSGKNYCFKGNYISVYNHRGGRYATNQDQDWDPKLATDWLCTTAGEEIMPTVENSDNGQTIRNANDLLIQNVSVHPKIESKKVDGKGTSGHWVDVTVHNAGSNSIDSSSARLACVEKSPSSQENELVKNITQSLNSGESYKMNFFITRKITQLCRNNFEINLPNDDVEFNNKLKIRLGKDEEGNYTIRHY